MKIKVENSKDNNRLIEENKPMGLKWSWRIIIGNYKQYSSSIEYRERSSSEKTKIIKFYITLLF